MPLWRIDAANSSSAASVMTVRGWKGLGSRRSTGSCRVAPSPAGTVACGSGSGRRALSPLPSAFLFMRDELLRQLQVGLAALGPDVVEKDGLAEAGGLAQADTAGHRGTENLVLEV